MLPCRTSVRPLYTYEAEHSLGGRNTATDDKRVARDFWVIQTSASENMEWGHEKE